ncbi:MAG: hypothetical protein ABW199_08110 [Caulobacterales bacterium]
MKNTIAAIALLALAACGQAQDATKEGDTPAQNTAASGPNLCEAKAEKVWVEVNGANYTVEAATAGPSCAEAVATLTVRGPEGVSLHQFRAPVQQIFGLRDAADPAAMQTEVTAWLGQTPPALANTGGVPDWREVNLQPDVSEFPFYPQEGMDRATYLSIRTARLPMFCFAQGRESMNCLYLKDGQVAPYGLQTFPG